ncbi:hypothetical protein KIW84_035879 [Lathyrus oleraceus]|uniref:Uncharacterized protein n=1 Tax=Pisum sativum TaxID=3888 RepID=A0A9D4Y3D9_PEA|nr:hypothetical protein KIW84_035879 [Pisum sativum]
MYAPGQAPAVPPGYQKPANNAPNMPRKSNLELMMESFIATQAQTNKDFLNQNIHTNEQLKQLASKVDAFATHNKMLETQISQVAQQQASTAAPAGTFPGQLQPNPKGHANAVILRSAKEIDGPVDPRLQNPAMYQKLDKTTTEEVSEPKEKEDNTREAEEKEKPYVPSPPYKPPIPYPQRLTNSKTAGQFRKFVELLKQLNITILFIEAIRQMPSYAKFLKEILSNKKKIEDNETVTLTAECNTIIQNNMPPKLKDLCSFSIPCVIGKFVIDKALCDLRASISVMPLTICKRLNMGELRPTKMYVQLADRSIKYLIGRSFLATAGAIINVKRGKLTFEVGEEKVEFILTQFLQAPAIDDTCYLLNVIDECVREIEMQETTYSDIMKIQIPPIFEDDNWHEPYQSDSLSECLALTPNHMPCPKKPDLELKALPKNLRYEFLDTELKRPVIVNADLGQMETEKLLDVLRKYPTALGYNIADLKEISPSICMHRIMLEEDCKTSREHKRRINPILSTVVKDEVKKLLDAEIIYPISNSQWVSPVHVVPKKGGVTVAKNEKGESIAQRVVTRK